MSQLKESTKNAIMNSQKLWISHPTGKMEGILAITESCKANPFCKMMAECEDSICHECYAQNSLGYEEGARLHYNRNTELLSESILNAEEIPKIDSDICRFETHGDWVNMNSAINEINIAKANPHCEFTVWTKRSDILAALAKDGVKQPKNFHVKVSSPMKNVVATPFIKEWLANHGWKVTYFTVLSLDYLLEKHGLGFMQEHGDEIITCGGRNCRGCMRCYGKHEKTDVIELIKQDVRRAKKLGIKIG